MAFSYFYNFFLNYYYSNIDIFSVHKDKVLKRASNVQKYCQVEKSRIPDSILINHLNHDFDILGAGLTNYNKPIENINFSRFNHSMEKFLCDLSPNYKKINWMKDPKTPYIWPDNIFYKKIKHSINQGYDVKYIWELGRLQHLPQMALAAIERDGKDRDRIVDEIKNQFIDFVVHNKPYFGTNWTCTMDVSIRAINIITTIELLESADNISLDFLKCYNIETYLYIHGEYILSNLEWFDDRNNHYLSNLCGLIYISTYLESNKELNLWLGFSVSQLLSESKRQFNNDGSNFEGSVSYHSLSLEILLLSYFRMSLIKPEVLDIIVNYTNHDFEKLSINRTKRKSYILENSASLLNYKSELEIFKCTLKKALDFLIFISDDDYRFPLIGDNDNGSIINLSPITYDGSNNFHYNCIKRILNFAYKFMFVDLDPALVGNEYAYFDLFYINNDFIFGNTPVNCKKNIKGSNVFSYNKEVINNKDSIIVSHNINHNDVEFEYKSYSDFGIIIWKANSFIMTLRTANKNIEDAMCHFHADQLSITLVIDGVNVIKDPGTPSYTSDIVLRNYYRSHFSHHGFNDSIKDNSNPFSKLNIVRVQTLSSSKKTFYGKVYYPEFCVFLKIEFTKKNISVFYKYKIDAKYRELLYHNYGRVTPYKSYGVYK